MQTNSYVIKINSLRYIELPIRRLHIFNIGKWLGLGG